MKRRDTGWIPEKVTAEKTLTMVVCLILAFGQVRVSAQSVLPTGGSVVAGQAAITTPSSGAMTIDQSSANAIINWDGFSVGGGASVDFQNGQGATLNRVTGADLSRIDGALSATGSLYVINENGIIVGPSGRIETGGRFVGSTRDIANEDFLNGGAHTFSGTGSGDIENYGTITSLNDDVVLIARRVTNSGEINAPGGTAAMGAGGEVLLQDTATADGLMYVRLPSADASVTHEGVVNAASAELRANGGNIYTLAGNRSGEIHANGSRTENGRIFLTAESGNVSVAASLDATRGTDGGDINVSASNLVTATGDIQASGARNGGSVSVTGRNVLSSGTLAADGASGIGGAVTVTAERRVLATTSSHISANGGEDGGSVRIAGGASDGGGVFTSGTMSATGGAGEGGEIRILGEDLDLVAAKADVSGDTGGGHIAIGYEGTQANPDIIAATVALSPDTELKADARVAGDGGIIAAWSTDETRFAATSFARGGALGGDGGLVEASSLDEIAYAGITDASAPNGAKGVLLLDPKNLRVTSFRSASPVGVFQVIQDPNGGNGNKFGRFTVDLGNGNLAVSSEESDFGGDNVGAVYLFSKVSGALISALTGSTAGDKIGSAGVIPLGNGNFVVASPWWDKGGTVNVGAVTWVSGATGLTGSVSDTNSLVGSSAHDWIGGGGLYGTYEGGVTVLSNHNYVVAASYWDNGAVADVGAVTWGSGTSGVRGAVDSANSLIGVSSGDRIGNGDSAIAVGIGDTLGVVALSNGNYVVRSSNFDFLGAQDVGAVTWVDGAAATSGTVSASNSLIGFNSGDNVGSGGVTALNNGHYVVASPNWDGAGEVDVGAVTWADGTRPTTELVSAGNSLTGTQPNDRVGSGGVTALTNGHYVVASPDWNGVIHSDVGAVTWADGTAPTSDVVSFGNSIRGLGSGKQVGSGGVVALSNGNYVIISPLWDNGSVVDAGAVTWADGSGPATRVVGPTNSLVGSRRDDWLGASGSNSTNLTSQVVALPNGDYVVVSPRWDSASAMDAGAATLGDGTTGTTVGSVNSTNSLIGGTASDQVGSGGAVALNNGHYVVVSPSWNNAGAPSAGAVTWGNGTSGAIGLVSTANSLVGETAGTFFGSEGVVPFGPDGYLVPSGTPLSGVPSGGLTVVRGGTGAGETPNATNTISSPVPNGLLELSTSTVSNDGTVTIGAPSYQGGGAVLFGLLDPNAVTFNRAPGVFLDVHPDFVTNTLNTGTDVTLQANNDIVFESNLIANNPTGDGGNLTAEAGRRIVVFADIVTDNGDLIFKVNGGGVNRGERANGEAEIAVVPGAAIDVGTGTLQWTVFKGDGADNEIAGDINFYGNNAVTAGRVLLLNFGNDNEEHQVRFGEGTQITASGAGDAIVTISKIFNNKADAGLLNLTGSGRFIAASADYEAFDSGGLAGGNFYGLDLIQEDTVFDVTAPGNRFVFARQPELLISSDSKTREYGLDNPAFTVSVSGLVNGDSIEQALSQAVPAVETSANASSDVGQYRLVPGGRGARFSSPIGYSVRTVSNFLTITPATLVVAAENASREYGLANPAFTEVATGFRNGDTYNSAISGHAAFTTAADRGSSVGDYAVSASLGSMAAVNGNYAFSFADGTLTVTPASLSVAAENARKEEGQANPMFTARATGLRNGDDISVVRGLGFLSNAVTDSTAGTYFIRPIGGVATNYSLIRVDGELTVTASTNTGSADTFRDPGVIRIVEVAGSGSDLGVSVGGQLASIFTSGLGEGFAAFAGFPGEDSTDGGTGNSGTVVRVDLGLSDDGDGSDTSFGFQLPFNFSGCTDASACVGVPDSIFGSSFVMVN